MLLDGNSLAFRPFYALPAENFKTRGGLTTNADQPRVCAVGGVAKSATPRDAKRERQKADLADELTTLREAIEQFLDKLESL